MKNIKVVFARFLQELGEQINYRKRAMRGLNRLYDMELKACSSFQMEKETQRVGHLSVDLLPCEYLHHKLQASRLKQKLAHHQRTLVVLQNTARVAEALRNNKPRTRKNRFHC